MGVSHTDSGFIMMLNKIVWTAIILSLVFWNTETSAKVNILFCEGINFSKNYNRETKTNSIIGVDLDKDILIYSYGVYTFFRDSDGKLKSKGKTTRKVEYKILTKKNSTLSLRGKKQTYFYKHGKSFKAAKDIVVTGKFDRASGDLTLETNSISDANERFGWRRNLKCKEPNRFS
jgi:hypothetical protein